ncbi:XRE family transcriptional regulator [Streptomyces sp. NPDC017979]|uniref:XRE family transcriptional regulator n=1 Tax=Streptomyces sp. NPDC017979 TaxID=3365024 RepID=UPI003796D5F5
MTRPAPCYKIVSITLLEALMKRTGRGDAVSIRQLADRAGVPHGTIGNLLTGEQIGVRDEATAHAIAAALGVDLLVLWLPDERAASALPRAQLRAVATA